MRATQCWMQYKEKEEDTHCVRYETDMYKEEEEEGTMRTIRDGYVRTMCTSCIDYLLALLDVF